MTNLKKKNCIYEKELWRMTGQYKVISDNLGEYNVVSKDNVIVATEIQHRITAETFCEELNILAEENEQLKYELDGMENLLKSYQKTIKHDAKLLADATKKGYLPPLDDWEEL